MASLSGWAEALVFSLLFLGLLGIVTTAFNVMYDENHEIPFTEQSEAQTRLLSYMSTSQEQIEGGEVEFDARTGITLKSSWGLATGMTSIIWGFITGGWLENIISAWNLGETGTILAFWLRMIYFISLVFASLYILFKVVT